MKLLLVGLVAAGAMLAGLGNALFGHHDYTVNAYFLSAEGLVPRNDVVINGARVGSVSAVTVAPDGDGPGGARVTMQIDTASAPLRRGTRATIRPKGLLGNMFVELTPSLSGNAVIPSGGAIPQQDTTTPVDLDQVMDLFDAQTRSRIQTLTREGGAALNGRGSDLNTFLAALPSVMQDLAAVTGKIAEQDKQLNDLDIEFDRIAQMMAAEDQAFRRDLTNGGSLLDVTAAHEEKLKAELVYADDALQQLEVGLHGHEKDLNAALKAMPGLLDELKALSEHSSTALAIIDPCMGDIVSTIAEMADAQSYRDANGNMLRVHPYLTNSTETDTTRLTCGGR
jgi:phospholipid/cholesterol/gamma-HCH transport system substrate-binding protein